MLHVFVVLEVGRRPRSNVTRVTCRGQLPDGVALVFCPCSARTDRSVAVIWLLANSAHALGREATVNAPVYPRQYVAANWLPEGLPQSSVYDIAQDRDGYLWLTTWGGLVRFDGVRFRVFTSADFPALGSGRVMAVCATRAGVAAAIFSTSARMAASVLGRPGRYRVER